MNAADHRHLTPILGAACIVAAAVLVTLALGVGRRVHWQAAGKPAALPASSAATKAAVPPLKQFSDVWQHPLFNADRQPADESAGGTADVRLGDLQLTGIIITPDLHVALLHGPPDKDVVVREGENVGDSGWTLVKLKDRSAVFERAGQRTELKLKTGVPDAVFGDMAAPDGKPPPGQSPKGMSLNPPGSKASRATRQRMQALRKRIESRRQQMRASSNQGH